MNGPSKITSDYSSIVGLKAELIRKRLEAREIKAKSSAQNIPKPQKPKVKVKKSQKKDNSSPKVIEIEDVSTLQKSKLMLEAKSNLYDTLKSRGVAHDLFLVDFSQKPDSASEKSESDDDLGDVNYDSDDNFVEYKDCFGRTRKCLREDLPRMQEKDNLLRQKISKDPPPAEPVVEEKIEEPLQREPEIEIMRKKWEEQTKKLADKVNIHYQDVLFDEARAHGVGYYNFSTDEEQRAKQQENLEKLRKETEQKQKEIQDLKEMKQKLEQNRLRVARIRQRIRAGLPPELPEEEEVAPKDDTKKSEEEKTQNLVEEKKEENENSLAIIEDKVKAFGELLGKRTHWREMTQEEWVDKRRKDRLSEFAPTYDGFKSAGCLEFGNFVSEYGRGVSEERSFAMDGDPLLDNGDTEVIGPLPMWIPLPYTPAPISISVSPSIYVPPSISEPPASEEKDEKRDDSDIIGPMPCADSPAFIPLPPNPPPSTIPLPPPKELSSNLEVRGDDSKIKNAIDSDKIAAGLRYLREKFEKDKKRGN